jgi:3-oxoacyl-[acyl-carrier protein] reductase
VVETNLIGNFNLCHAVIPAMLRQGEGRLLLVSSGLGERPGPFSSAYRASKAGVTHFAQVLAGELAGTGVTSNAVYPGLVDTDLLHRSSSGVDGAAPWAAYTRAPEDVAWFLLWLCGPANRALTGQVVGIEDPRVQARLRRFQRRCTLAGAVADAGNE